MKVIALIPARYASVRFPGKLLKNLDGIPVILHTYRAVSRTGLFDEVYVVTDDIRIAETVEKDGGKVLMPEGDFRTGSDRIAAAARQIDADIIINVQGDEPFTSKKLLEALIDVFHRDNEQKIDVASAVFPLHHQEQIDNPNNVKVVMDENSFALYFSRHPIPYPAQPDIATYYQHIGIYAFRRNALLRFATLPACAIEKSEKLENLRFLYYGMKVKMIVTREQSIGIDTPEDLREAEKRLKNIQRKTD